MVALRRRWFRSPAYQSKIYSRTLMITQVRKDYRSDEGLVALMGQLKVDGIKIGRSLVEIIADIQVPKLTALQLVGSFV